MPLILKRLLCAAVISAAVTSNVSAFDSLAYLYAGNSATYLNNIKRTNGSITIVCPDYYELYSNGSLKASKPVDKSLVSALQAMGIKVTPFLSNHWNRNNARSVLGTPTSRHALAQELADEVARYGFDGLDIDIENITETDRDNFTDFIRILRLKLPDSKTIAICVPANPWALTTGWQGAYHYTELSRYADHLFIMAYDEHYSGGPAGAVASISFVEKSVKYAVDRVDPQKIMLGVPFYGRYWSGTNSSALAMTDIDGLVSQYASRSWYDEATKTARAEITIPKGVISGPHWGGIKLLEGVYDVWYDSARSLEEKLALVRKYNLKGAGCWALGQESAYVWTGFSTWLSGIPFTDIDGHWAQSYIQELYNMKLVDGTGGGLFMPQKNLTRAEAAVILVRMTGISGGHAAADFPDTAGHWARSDIAAARYYGIVNGDDGMFRPNSSVTREEFAVMTERCLILADTVDFNQRLFSDVSPEANHWSNAAIVKLTLQGILSGREPGRFYPKANISRAECSKIIRLALDLPMISKDNIRTLIEPLPVEPR